MRYRAVARVIKTYGKRGEVVTEPVDGLPLLLREGITVAVVPPRLKGNRYRTVVACSSSETGQLVRLSGVSGLDDASALVGRTILLPEDELPADFALHDVRSLVGRTVVDALLGELGAIAEVMRGPANDVWVVEGPRGEVLVPVVEAYLDPLAEEGPITCHLPAGLVDLPPASGDAGRGGAA